MQCVVCCREFDEFGHDARPIKNGRCCNKCNTLIVIPERIRLMRMQEKTVQLVQVSRWVLEQAFEALPDSDIDEILQLTKNLDEYSYQRLSEVADKVKAKAKAKAKHKKDQTQ